MNKIVKGKLLYLIPKDHPWTKIYPIKGHTPNIKNFDNYEIVIEVTRKKKI